MKFILKKLWEKKNKKLLVFSKYDGSFKQIKDFLNDEGVNFSELKGSSNTISKTIKKYKSIGESDSLDVILLNAKFFGCGLNLENTTDIFIYHNMGDCLTNQVIGRAQRPGRTSKLNVTKFCYENEL